MIWIILTLVAVVLFLIGFVGLKVQHLDIDKDDDAIETPFGASFLFGMIGMFIFGAFAVIYIMC